MHNILSTSDTCLSVLKLLLGTAVPLCRLPLVKPLIGACDTCSHMYSVPLPTAVLLLFGARGGGLL